MSLLEERLVYKPFKYPWAYEAWLKQQRIHWLPEEVPLAEDVKDWEKNLTAPEKNLLTQIFRFFVQADVEVNNCYMKHYSKVFKPTEVQMMLGAFSNTETIHIAAYSHLLDTIGMAEVEYSAFLEYEAMKNKFTHVLIDTAGRLQNKKNLMEEYKKIANVTKKIDQNAPHEVLLVLDATSGQNVINQVEEFNKIIPITGLIMTKLDGTAKGGILIAVAKKYKLPIVALGLGEKEDDLQIFEAEKFADAFISTN